MIGQGRKGEPRAVCRLTLDKRYDCRETVIAHVREELDRVEAVEQAFGPGFQDTLGSTLLPSGGLCGLPPNLFPPDL